MLEKIAEHPNLAKQAIAVSERIGRVARVRPGSETIQDTSRSSRVWEASDRIFSFPRMYPEYVPRLLWGLTNSLSCWDGVNLDSPNHKSHVAFPLDDSPFQRGSPCPASHPVRLPQLFYEVMWDTEQFNDLSLWPEDGSQPLVFSTGDP